MKEILKNILFFLLRLKYRFIKKIYIGSKTRLNTKTKLEGGNRIGSNNSISSTTIGYGTYMGDNNLISKSNIGKYCSLASNIRIIFGKHPTKQFVSTHPAFFSTKKQAGFTYVSSPLYDENDAVNDNYSIVIGNDVWIGENVNLISGVKIGNGAIIGANALVTRDCEPYYIYGGIPAKKIGQRFSDSQIINLEKIKWWDKDETWIIENISKFNDINKFIEEYINV